MRRLVADLHVHGRFSVATSRSLSLQSLHEAALCKGVDVLGTGDIVHPMWKKEAREALREEDGLFLLRPELVVTPHSIPPRDVRFMLTTEISCIYSDGGRVRKVHHLVCLPSFEAVDALSASLARLGSIESDGRPILGLSSRDLLEVVLSCDPRALLIPAHIWTPWFSALGSRSGYDSIEECYGDLAPHIVAIETGLSSDPAMNWRLSALDRFAIISCSDAHSADKVGREATVFRCDPTFEGIARALQRCGGGIEGTIEFFPEEGKYHLDGHRACGVRLEPEETKRHGGLCPRCGAPVTVGVMHRVGELADRLPGVRPAARPGFVRLVPLAEVLGQALGVGPSSRAVQTAYAHILRLLGPEIPVLTEMPLDELERVCGDRVAEAVANMREGKVETEAGYDGQYGTIHLLGHRDRPPVPAQKCAGMGETPARAVSEVSVECDRETRRGQSARYTVVIAGPGSGKTRLLTQRMAQTLSRTSAPVRGVTFTRAAAQELKERLTSMTGPTPLLWTGTLHQAAYELLRAAGREVNLHDDRQRAALLQWWLARSGHPVSLPRALRLVHRISALRHGTAKPPSPPFGDELLCELYARAKEEAGAVDYDDLIDQAIEVSSSSDITEPMHLFVDEFQDLDRSQYEFIRTLGERAHSLMIIGDPYQSIYGFRGGDPTLVSRFESEHPGCEVLQLGASHRCPELVLRAADAVVGRRSSMVSATGYPGTVELLRASSVFREARMVAGRIKELLGGTTMERAHGDAIQVRGFGDIAVLVRTGTMAGVFARALADAGIPCRVGRAVALSEDAQVGEVLAWLRLAVNPTSKADLLLVRGWDRDGAVTPLTPTEGRDLGAVARCSPVEALERILALLGSRKLDPRRTEILMGAAKESIDLPDFIARITVIREAGVMDTRVEAVRVITMHAAKGLEFGAVFVTGFREGLLPLAGADASEEARLCYVAMTRARRYVALTYAGEPRHLSRFAKEIPPGVLSLAKGTAGRGVQLELDLGIK